ncbi:tRNA (adenosine(37)-N6)-threonylcarbamoyltransferase complex ATPase subunit type 1 TsaE [Alteribacter natronophilus]|uniref:tRNA (adenosine(37)-N6)-threonylcarbamoyltransferase complex ATPase subunit type 1 TsaE n=1 Tax=Alteribacter natronophilus TaxID=2583810 RepID=UPI00110E010E|nr:tRNA (adenosine(37)-N6)-threonylcarbamoyltransferase complex ATPase subunit type 1 TsaE [Alteribacter natronophilus]TMW70873.1 tRNA (adenosine(37)-N6)-threonylcarbamoyltransferase complex ATPase subunit type 1 TsaE [Alteribacter natronophilus]
MSEYVMKTGSPEETMALAEKLAGHLKAGDLITLDGDLGAGKTSFTKGLAKGLGVKKNVSSPTFTIMKEYKGTDLALYHMDAYRLEEGGAEMGLEEYFEGDGVSVVEWPEMIENELPAYRLAIHIRHIGDTAREIRLEPAGDRYRILCEELMENERTGN